MRVGLFFIFLNFQNVFIAGLPVAMARLTSQPSSESVFEGTSSVSKSHQTANEANKVYGASKQTYCMTPGADPSVCGGSVTAPERKGPCKPGYIEIPDLSSSKVATLCVPENLSSTSERPKCPEGQINYGGRGEQDICIPDPAWNNISSEREKVTEDKNKPNAAASNQDSQVSEAQKRQAQQCESQARSALSACEAATSQIGQMRSEVERTSQSMQNQTPAKACEQMAVMAGNAVNQMQNSASSCQAAVSSCASSCQVALSSLGSVKTSAAYVTATGGQSQCQSANSSLSNINMNISQMQSASQQSNRCYADLTGQQPRSDEISGAGQRGWKSSENLGNQRLSQGSLVLGDSEGQAGLRRTQDLPQAAPLGNGEPSQVSRSVSQPEDFKASGRKMPQVSGTSGSFSSAAGAVGSRDAAGNSKGSLQGAGSLKSDDSGGLYGGDGQRRTATWRLNSWGAESDPSNRGVRREPQKPGQSVDLRRFLPTPGGRRPASQSLSDQVGGKHGNLFLTVRTRYVNVFSTPEG